MSSAESEQSSSKYSYSEDLHHVSTDRKKLETFIQQNVDISGPIIRSFLGVADFTTVLLIALTTETCWSTDDKHTYTEPKSAYIVTSKVSYS